MNKKSLFEVKVDENITLRIRNIEDSAILFNLINKNRKHLSEFLNWVPKTKEVSDTENFILRKLEEFEKGTSCDFGIYYDNILIGSAGFHSICKTNKHASIGYLISKEYEGKGIVTKVVTKLLEIGLEKYKLHRVEIRMIVENKKSQAIPKKLGFKHEGTLRDIIFVNNKFHSMEIWSTLLCPIKKGLNNKKEDDKCNGK